MFELQPFSGSDFFSQLFFSLLLILILLLATRAVVARTYYSSVLVIVVFGLGLGVLLTRSGITTLGMPELPILGLIAKATVIALIPIFFTGGQELRKIYGEVPLVQEETFSPSVTEMFYGTSSSHLKILTRSFFLLLGLVGVIHLLLNVPTSNPVANYYPLIGYISLIVSMIMIDAHATIPCRRNYVQRGLVEVFLILAIVIAANSLSVWQGNTIALPEILFIVILSATLGGIMYSWQQGATFKALVNCGLPIVLTASFIIGGSSLVDIFDSFEALNRSIVAVLIYGFLGQLFWLFGGMSLIIYIGKNRKVHNVVTGISGALSHTGLLAASTANELGAMTRTRAPIMSIISLFSYLFVTIIDRISLGDPLRVIISSLLVVLLGIVITGWSLSILKRSNHLEADEVRAMMLFSFGWQIIALFCGTLLLQTININADYGTLTYSANLSHIGLFAVLQDGLLRGTTNNLLPFIFAMPFLAQPILFWTLGHAMSNQERFSNKSSTIVLFLGGIGVVGIALTALLIFT